MKTLQSAFIAGGKWFEMKSRFAGSDDLAAAAEEYAEEETTEAERNLNRAIDAETELRKAKDVAKRLIDAIKSDDCSLTGSPQHWHNVKGKWDADGSDCEECAAFDALRELAK